ncbi:SCO family protein [Chitinophaga pendula]|uniref:SCO family protein n=1 Tax=Chitinophaga TaxID=79328 RepID=UPI000BB03C2F|nr:MULTISPECIES: SCO family protein [Chitinophaga]ASZ11014.1 SCO family protein [Chitinophaga sp. MD30]UCJ05995.1 SCO family protein [Chitinophaga pendula]
MKHPGLIYMLGCGVVLLLACGRQPKQLPILGQRSYDTVRTGGTVRVDTLYPEVPAFSFVDQDSQVVNNATFRDRIYVTDFIFLSCPTICPKMTANMLEVYQVYDGDTAVMLLSHTIDPKRDTVGRLKAYTKELGVSRQWRFVTGNQDTIFRLAEKGYFSAAGADSTAPGGYIHGGGLLLVDRHRHIRGVYNGMDRRDTERLIKDIRRLREEQF